MIGWYLLNATSCYVGAYRGYTQSAAPVPSPVNSIVRPIPVQPMHHNIYFVSLVCGLIQFVSMYAEFSYLLDSIFRANWYAMFGFLLLNLLTLIITIALLSILTTYMQLCYQNHHWWWRSFLIGASGGIYISLYCLFYMGTQMDLYSVGSDLSFIFYAVLFIGCYSTAAGAISVSASYSFVKSIYGNIRKD